MSVKRVISVVDLVVPGSGLIADVLFTTALLCGEMKEGQDACKRVHFRLNAIFEELQEMEKKNILPPSDKLDMYATVVFRYLQYLQRYREQNIAKRLIKHRAMMGELTVIQEEIEMLFKIFNLAAVALMMDWKQQWEADRIAMAKVLDNHTKSSVQVLREVPSVRAQSEAILDLKFELEQRCDRQNKETIQLMKAMLKTVVQTSKSTVGKVPPWFLPSNEVDTDSEPFAVGSCGSVYRGTWGLGTAVVVKRFNVEDKVVSERAQRKIESEINIWYRLNHPHVIKMYGASHVSSPPFVVCEDATNGDLSDFLARSEENSNQMWRLLYEAALGLEYIHSMDVVHGDLKLNNILVASNGQAKLSDFGLSAMRTCATLSKTSESQSGGLRWRAPECLKKRPTFESDVYSFAMCIIEATTGEPPFSFLDDDSVRDNLKNGEIPEQPDEMADEMWEQVVSMTHVDPKKRLSLRDVILKLKKFASNEQVPKKSVCSECGCEIADRARFCSECGASTTSVVVESTVILSSVCSNCGFELSDGARFCSECGTVVSLSKTSWTSEKHPVGNLEHAQSEIVNNQSDMDSSGNPSAVDEISTVDSLLDNNDVVGHNSIWAKLKRFLHFGKGFHKVKGGHSLSMPIDGDFGTVVSRVPRNQVKILSLISDAGYQKIHRGTYKRQAVVIKELVDEDRVDDFLVEAKMMADLDHPYIIQYVGVSWTSLADLCMLTELVEGGDLQSLLSRLSSEGHPQGINYDKLRIANHVAQALTYLHSFQPVRLHRDVTSKEVLLTENLDAKLAGFSLSREMDDQTMTAGVGTVLWIAPEVAMGEHYDEKADIFSFGVVLSELDTQSLPYAQARANSITDMKILRMVAGGELQVEFSPGCLAPVVKLGKECVALDPSSRPSAPEVAYRLQMIMKDAFGQSN